MAKRKKIDLKLTYNKGTVINDKETLIEHIRNSDMIELKSRTDYDDDSTALEIIINIK